MVFADDDNAIDTKTHFEYITHKIDLSAEGLIKAVEEAIAMKLGATDEKTDKKSVTKKKSTKKPEPIEEPVDDEMKIVDEVVDDIGEDIVEDIFDDEVVEDVATPVDTDVLATIRASFKAADANTKSKVKVVLSNYGGKLATEMKPSDVESIQKILGI